jgi:hypothetical protein
MHILYVHPNYPAQFGHIAQHLARRYRFRCTFVSERPAGRHRRVERIRYRARGGAMKFNHYCTRTFENNVRHAHGVYIALKARHDIRPDLIVGHSGFGTTLFLSELYRCPVVNFFEYFYRTEGLPSPRWGEGSGVRGSHWQGQPPSPGPSPSKGRGRSPPSL